MGNFLEKNRENEITYYSDLKNQNNILIPFKETTGTTVGNIEMNYQNFIINPQIEAEEWENPEY